MIATLGYFFAAYLVCGFVFVALKGGVTAQLTGHARRVRTRVGVALMLIPWVPYFGVALQTALFGSVLRPHVNQALKECGGMCGDGIEKSPAFDVLSVTPYSAKVYLVTPCMETFGVAKSGTYRSATILTISKARQGWHYVDFDSPWSDCGNAHGNIFPPDPRGF